MQKLFAMSISLLSIFLAACGGSSSTGTTTDNAGAATALSTPEQVDVISASSNNTAALTANIRAALNARAFNSAGTDYVTDAQNIHVWHPALQPVESVNSILCFIGQLQADDMLNQGDYVALIDEGSCEKGTVDQGSSGNQSSGADQAPSFVEAIANVSRTDANSPMVIKLWVPEMSSGDNDDGDAKTIRALIQVSEAPSANKPFGEFRMSFGMFVNGDGIGSGELGTSTSSNGQLGLTLYETGQENFDGNSVTFMQRASILTNASQTSGVAVTQSSISGNVPNEVREENNFGYALSYDNERVLVNKADTFESLTSDTSSAVCLNRNNFHEAVWRYNLYDANSGEIVELNTGFPFRFESDPDSGVFDTRGHVGYWGVWTDGDASLENGQTIREEIFGDQPTTAREFTLVTAPGKLIKQTVTALALTELDGIDFNYYDSELTGTDYNQWVVNYLSAGDERASSGAGFYKVAGMTYGNENSPPEKNTLDNPVKLTLANDYEALNMWSQQLGGAVSYRKDADEITYFAEEFVDGDETAVGELFTGGASSATLYCYDNCPKGNLSLSDLATYDSPFDHPLRDAMGGPVTPIEYTFSRTGDNAFTLVRTSNAQRVVLDPSITSEQLQQSQHSWGLRSGNMITVPLSNNPQDIYSLPTDSVVYRWETGRENWNRMTIVKDANGNAVTFDKPKEFRYVHTANNDRSTSSVVANRFAGQTFMLNYGGPGQLWGIPSRAVGAEGENVSGKQFRYYPAFNLADGVSLGANNQYVIKAIDIEQKMVREGSVSACSDLNFDGLIEPPSALSANYNVDIGPVPTVNSAPAVVGGIVQ